MNSEVKKYWKSRSKIVDMAEKCIRKSQNLEQVGWKLTEEEYKDLAYVYSEMLDNGVNGFKEEHL